MKISEIRFGNKVYYNGNHNEIGTVTGFSVDIFGNKKIELNYKCDITYPLDKLKPIALNKENIVELGFKKIENVGEEIVYTKNTVFEVWLYDLDIYYKETRLETDLRYYHQLQNILEDLQ